MVKQNLDSHDISVLVVDDDPTVRTLIKRNLESQGARVIEAATGLDGIISLINNKIYLVVLDIKLPDFSGWGILGLLRSSEKFHDMPVILVTVEPYDATLIAKHQPVEYIQKPFDIRDFVSKVDRIMNSCISNNNVISELRK